MVDHNTIIMILIGLQKVQIVILKLLNLPKLIFFSRLRRRIESYRRRQTDCMPRFDQSFNGLCEQNLQDTIHLKQRYLDTKSKRVPKSKEKKQQESIQSSVHVVSFICFFIRAKCIQSLGRRRCDI